jgi:hypothetical protein
MSSRKEWRPMKEGKFVALLAALVLVAGANADTLRLRSGQTVEGTFLGADTRQLTFLETNGQPKTYSLADVKVITFATIPEPTASVPLPMPTNATLLAGALIPVRMVSSLDTSKSKVGDIFTGTLDSNLVAGGVVVAPKGTTVHGKVTTSSNAGRAAGRSELTIQLSDIVINGAAQPISTSGFQQKGASEGAKTAKRTAGGAGLGAAIGAISGNAGKGAAIGAVSGAGVSMLKKGEAIRIPSETLLEFSLSQPTILPVQH